jgi:hypothetical protein
MRGIGLPECGVNLRPIQTSVNNRWGCPHITFLQEEKARLSEKKRKPPRLWAGVYLETGALRPRKAEGMPSRADAFTATRLWGRRGPNHKVSKSISACEAGRVKRRPRVQPRPPRAACRGETFRPDLSAPPAQAAARRPARAVRRTAASRRSTSSGLSKKPSAPRRIHSRCISPEGSELATKTFDAGRWLLT